MIKRIMLSDLKLVDCNCWQDHEIEVADLVKGHLKMEAVGRLEEDFEKNEDDPFTYIGENAITYFVAGYRTEKDMAEGEREMFSLNVEFLGSFEILCDSDAETFSEEIRSEISERMMNQMFPVIRTFISNTASLMGVPRIPMPWSLRRRSLPQDET